MYMKTNPRFCFFFEPLGRRLNQVFDLLRKINLKETEMTNELALLKAQVEQTVAIQQQTITLLNQLVARLANLDLPQDIIDITTSIKASTDQLSQAVSSIPLS